MNSKKNDKKAKCQKSDTGVVRLDGDSPEVMSIMEDVKEGLKRRNDRLGECVRALKVLADTRRVSPCNCLEICFLSTGVSSERFS